MGRLKASRLLAALALVISLLGLPIPMRATTQKLPQAVGDKLTHCCRTAVSGETVTFYLKEHQLFGYQEEAGASQESHFLNESLLLENVLDLACYNIDQTADDELILLTLDPSVPSMGPHEAYGKAVAIYKVSLEGDVPKLSLSYQNDISLVQPWMLTAGKIDDREPYGQLFVGVYKDTRFYPEVINRPFFFSWQGSFIKRKWTGSYLSVREYVDLCLVDWDQDGCDEAVALEKQPDGTYTVSIYKWQGFGFEYLLSSQESYKAAQLIACEKTAKAGSPPIIWVMAQTGCRQVQF